MSFAQEILIALGSNQPTETGLPGETLRAACDALEKEGYAIRQISRFFTTPAFPKGNGPDFVNAAAVLSGPKDPHQVLNALHRVEAAFGRTRDVRWGARGLDLDLLAMGDQVWPDAETHKVWRDLPLEAQQTRVPEELLLPHPRLQDRAFVLVPLADVAPEWRHPLLGKPSEKWLRTSQKMTLRKSSLFPTEYLCFRVETPR